MKATPQEYHFHQRVSVQSDPIAFAELAEWLYDSLVRDVRQRAGHQADPILVEEAVGQALLDYHDKPENYDPYRKGLQSYLVMAAFRDFQNARARERRLADHQISIFDPAFRESDIIGSQDDIEEQMDAEELWAIIDETFPDPVERRIVELIVNHVHTPEPYAHLLHLDDLPGDEQLRQIKLVKYRVARRLRRNLARWLSRTGGDA